MQRSFARQKLGFFPTPLHELTSLSDYLKGPRIFIKRDDCSGLGLGGNKVRKLEYILADACSQEADVLITVGAVSSNHARQTAAAAALLGLECQLVLMGREPDSKQGNYLLDHLLGAKTMCVKSAEVDEAVNDLMQQCLHEGKKPYFIPAGGHNMWGTVAYMEAYQEIINQAFFPVDAMVCAVGTGTTCAGLQLGHELAGDKTRVVGISVGGNYDWCLQEIISVLHETQSFLGMPLSSPDTINIRDEYVGAGYTRTYPGIRDAIYLLAQKEGVFLDPVYTGKAMVGFLDMIEKGEFNREQKVVFLHTGGAPEIFNMNNFLENPTS